METKKQRAINNLKSTYCRLKPSKIEGVGVFAVRDIPRGTNPFKGIKEQTWQKFEVSDLKRIDRKILKMIDDFFVIEKDGTVYIPEKGLNGIDVSFFVNNSKNPNLKITGDGVKKEIGFVAVKKIKAGQELTVSYATYDDKYKK